MKEKQNRKDETPCSAKTRGVAMHTNPERNIIQEIIARNHLKPVEKVSEIESQALYAPCLSDLIKGRVKKDGLDELTRSINNQFEKTKLCV